MRALSLLVVLFISQGLFGQEFTKRVYSGNINGISSTSRLESGSLHNDETENRFYGMILGSDGSTYILMVDPNNMMLKQSGGNKLWSRIQ